MQNYLLRRFGSGLPSAIWYPAPSERGPGHSSLAFDHLAGGSLLRRLVHDATEAGVQHLLLSSEDFSFADADAFERLSFLESPEVRLVVTLSSLKSRIPSLWQEMVKHGHPNTLSRSMDQILDSPGMQPTFITSFASAVKPKELSVILISRSAGPETLLRDFCAALQIEESAAHFTYSNSSLGYFETEVLRQANSLMSTFAVGSEPSKKMRNIIIAAMQSSHWKDISPTTQPNIPSEYIHILREKAEHTLRELEDIREIWPTKIFGSKENLF